VAIDDAAVPMSRCWPMSAERVVGFLQRAAAWFAGQGLPWLG
jgi:hypothetical protein